MTDQMTDGSPATTATLQQGSPDWIAARLGKIGASQVAAALARTKSGWGASRATLMAEKIAERLTGVMVEGYKSPAMEHGTATEAEACAAYAFYRDVAVEVTGWHPHPRIANAGCSPDRLIGADGLLEIKCPNTATHIDTLMRGTISGAYMQQMQWQMACTGRLWCDFTSYDPRMPESLRLKILRVDRDPDAIEMLEHGIEDFLWELDEKEAELRRLCGV